LREAAPDRINLISIDTELISVRLPQTPPQLDDLLRRPEVLTAALGELGYRAFAAEQGPRYRHWQKIRTIARDRGLDPDAAWAAIKCVRQAQLRQTPFRSGHGEQLVYMLPDHLQAELMLIDQQLAGRLVVDE